MRLDEIGVYRAIVIEQKREKGKEREADTDETIEKDKTRDNKITEITDKKRGKKREKTHTRTHTRLHRRNRERPRSKEKRKWLEKVVVSRLSLPVVGSLSPLPSSLI